MPACFEPLSHCPLDVASRGQVMGQQFGLAFDDRDEPAAQYGSSPDSPLEGTGFEPPVPRKTPGLWPISTRTTRRDGSRKREFGADSRLLAPPCGGSGGLGGGLRVPFPTPGDGQQESRLAPIGHHLVDCGHMSGLCVRHGWPLAQMGCADRVPNTAVMSKKHHCVPRVVPILGPTDRHLAAVLASARAVMRCAAQTACGWR